MNRIPGTSERSQAPPGGPGRAPLRVLIPAARIARRVRRLARAIERDFAGRDLVIVALLNGTIVFLADLIRHLSLPLRLDFIGISSYGQGLAPGPLTVTKELRLDLRGRDVLVVDDILDSGRTLRHVLARIRALRPRRVRVCVLLEKQVPRAVPIRAHYLGFRIPNTFVVGYGLDLAERHRNLPFLASLQPETAGLRPQAATRPKVRPASRFPNRRRAAGPGRAGRP